jgi:hypothetical protein
MVLYGLRCMETYATVHLSVNYSCNSIFALRIVYLGNESTATAIFPVDSIDYTLATGWTYNLHLSMI